MAATSLPVARLLELRIAIAWQEAVAVVNAADMLSAAEAIPITLDHCSISTDGTVQLSTDLPSRRGQEVSAPQLLRALLEGQAAPAELHALVVTADDALASFPSERDPQAQPPFDIGWFVSANPLADVARLAARGLAAEATQGAVVSAEQERPRAEPPLPPLTRTRPRVPLHRGATPRRSGVTVRVQRGNRSVLLALGAVVLAIAGGVATLRLAVGAGIAWPVGLGDGAVPVKAAAPSATSGAAVQVQRADSSQASAANPEAGGRDAAVPAPSISDRAAGGASPTDPDGVPSSMPQPEPQPEPRQ